MKTLLFSSALSALVAFASAEPCGKCFDDSQCIPFIEHCIQDCAPPLVNFPAQDLMPNQGQFQQDGGFPFAQEQKMAIRPMPMPRPQPIQSKQMCIAKYLVNLNSEGSSRMVNTCQLNQAAAIGAIEAITFTVMGLLMMMSRCARLCRRSPQEQGKPIADLEGAPDKAEAPARPSAPANDLAITLDEYAGSRAAKEGLKGRGDVIVLRV